MWAWLLPILLRLVAWLFKALSRFWSVFLVGAVIALVLLRFNVWKDTYGNLRYHAGYSQALTDHPSIVIQSGGVMNSNVVKTTGIEIVGWGIGVWHRR